jgi:hypothetical protein
MTALKKEPWKKKPGGRTLTKPNTRSHFKTFHSDAAEVSTLVRELGIYLAKVMHRGNTPEDTWTRWHSQTNESLSEISNKQISYATALPQLREIATNSQYPGAKQTGKPGKWICSQAVHNAEKGKPILRPKDKNETKSDHTPSPNLLESDPSQESDQSEPHGSPDSNQHIPDEDAVPT